VFESVKCFIESNNNYRYIETVRPAFGQCHIHIIVIDLGIEKSRDNIEMMDIPDIISGKGDEIPKSGEFSDRGISFSEVSSLAAFN